MTINDDRGNVITVVYKHKKYGDQSIGWPGRKTKARVFFDKKLVFSTNYIDSTGCSFAYRSASQKLMRQVYDFLLTRM